MRAAVLEEVGKIIYTEEYPKPIAGPDDALVKVHYCGICGSDVTNFTQGLFQMPLIMGHEFAGEVVELGKNLKDYKIGDKVLGINVQLNITQKGFKGLGIFQNGGFAEYVKVPSEFLFHAPASTSLKNSIMVESYALAIRAIKVSRIDANQKIMIVGGGNVGLAVLNTLLIKKNPKYVVVVEPFEFLRERAKEMGATETFSPNKVKIRKFFKKRGAPFHIIDCAGTDKSFYLAVDFIKRGGTITLEGLYRGTVSLPLLMMNTKELCIKGVMGHDREDILEAIDLFAKKLVDPGAMISDIVPLKDIQKAFEKYLAPGERKFIKTLVKI